jgi:hypothetical protein
MAQEVMTQSVEVPAFNNSANFEHAQRVAKALQTSDIIPKQFKDNIANVIIALEMANRIGTSPLMVMQNMYVIHGKPSWSSTFVISAINNCKKFSPLRYEEGGEGMDAYCTAWAYDLRSGDGRKG